MAGAQGAGGPLLSRRTLLGTAAAITAAGALVRGDKAWARRHARGLRGGG